MVQQRKWLFLPDLDTAPETYENDATPELTDDTSTIPEEVSQELNDDASGVDNRHLHTAQARTRFEPARVEARGVDFSDRLNRKRTSYITSTRRRSRPFRRHSDTDSDDEPETPDRKLARLRREIEELKATFAEEEKDQTANTGHPKDGINTISMEDIDKVSAMIDSTYISRNGAGGAEAEYLSALQRFNETRATGTANSTDSRPTDVSAQLQQLGLSSESRAQILSKAAELDERLSSMEKVLGLDGTTMPDTATASPKPVLHALADLDRHIAAISAGLSSENLDAAGRRVRQLMQEAEQLAKLRSATTSSAAPGTPTSATDGATLETSAAENTDSTAKINALYGTLSTIESLSPSLPMILDRLRTLRLIHASAGEAGTMLDAMEKRQTEQATEIAQWEEALRKIDASMSEGQDVLTANVKLVGDWVKDIEDRVAKLR